MLVVLSGCKASKPLSLQTHSIDWIKHRVTVGDRKLKNPYPATARNIADGEEAFIGYCAVCHGKDGQNTGVPFATVIDPPVPSLASKEVQSYTDGQLQWVIQHGISPSGMPPSDTLFSDEDIWKMVLYIRHLPKAGSLGAPQVYGGAPDS